MVTDSVDFGAIMVPLADVVPNPGNFRHLMVDVDELAASITRNGLDEPLVVMPADRVAAAWPEHAETISGGTWVLLWGHRRLAAARHVFAGDPQAQVPVIIRRDKVCDDAQMQLDLMTINAMAHRSWNPIEEARALRAVIDAGRTQLEVAELVGCHQSHVSGRLALLRLPAEIAEAVEAGKLGVADARKLARLDDQEQMRAVWGLYRDRREDAWITSIDQAIAEHADRTAYQVRRRAALDAAEAQGLRVVDPVEEFSRDVDIHRLDGPQLVEAARRAGTLVAGISGNGDLEYYTTSPATRFGLKPAGPDSDQRRAAAAARERAGRLLTAKPPAIPGTAAYLIDSFLRSAPDGWRPIAHRWLRWLRLGPSGEADSARWWDQVCTADWDTRVCAAHCLALAASEHHARTHNDWDTGDVAWLWLLITEAGYVPRRWERRRLAEADNGHEHPMPADQPPASAEAGWFEPHQQCSAHTRLTDSTVALLERDPRRFHEVEQHQRCQLEQGHPGQHGAHVQDTHAQHHHQFEQQHAGPLHLWARWVDNPQDQRITPAGSCPATRRPGVLPDEDKEACPLFAGHPGRHS